MKLFCADGQLKSWRTWWADAWLSKTSEKTRFRFEKIYLKPNRFQGSEEWRNTVEGGRRQRNISKDITRAIGLVKKKKKKKKKKGGRGWKDD
jgi:hypothetical protein